MTHSAALFRAANLFILDYPFDAALASALAIVDEAVVVVGQSQDDTLDWVRSLQSDYPGRVHVEETTFTFDLGWQESWWSLASSLTDAEWLLWLDADEVIYPSHAPALRELMTDEDIRLIRFPFVHLYATPAYQVTFPLTHNTRLGRRSAGFRMINVRTENNPNGAACAMTFGGGDVYRNAHAEGWPGMASLDGGFFKEVPILHYGWCRDARSLGISQTKQAAWYADGDGLEDGRIPVAEPYDFQLAEMLESGRAQAFEQGHPGVMERWFNAHADQWQELEEAVHV